MSITCGPMYKAGLEEFTGMDPNKVPLFAAGFISGQAEKIYLGACQAAMSRPSDDWWPTVMVIVHKVASRYSLAVATLPTSRGSEVWLCRSAAVAGAVLRLADLAENSPEWHTQRGLLCGVPVHQLDPQFHFRAGYGERCD